jgi:hypothetical protein
LVHNNKQFKEAYENRPELSRLKLKELVNAKESMLWR